MLLPSVGKFLQISQFVKVCLLLEYAVFARVCVVLLDR
jgi:hypothetical protein